MATDQAKTPSRATQVTLFEDRAAVTRVASAELPAGVSRVLLSGVGATVDDATLIVRLSRPDARVLSSKILRRIETRPEADDQALQEIEADLERCRRERRRAEQTLGRAEARVRRASALESEVLSALERVPRGAVADWAEAHREVDVGLSRALAEEAAAARADALASRDLARAEARASQARREKPQAVTLVEVEVEAGSAGPISLELEYRTPCALWRPEHVVQLSTPVGTEPAKLAIRTHATVWQTTGEEWREVALSFSTARPARSAAPPTLQDDILALRRKTEAEKHQVVIEARDQTIELARGGGGQAVDEMPGVEDGGEAQLYHAKRPTTVPSDGQPLRVDVSELALDATVDRLAIPERSEAVFLRARSTLASKRPLLAGPAAIMRGTELVGRSTLPFIAAGEPFELSLGIDDGARVRRKESVKRETTPLTGTQKITKTVRLYLSNLSGTTKAFLVKERFPVSEIADVTVELLSKGGASADVVDGFLSFNVELAPRAHRELELSYRIDAAAKVVLPF